MNEYVLKTKTYNLKLELQTFYKFQKLRFYKICTYGVWLNFTKNFYNYQEYTWHDIEHKIKNTCVIRTNYTTDIFKHRRYHSTYTYKTIQLHNNIIYFTHSLLLTIILNNDQKYIYKRILSAVHNFVSHPTECFSNPWTCKEIC